MNHQTFQIHGVFDIIRQQRLQRPRVAVTDKFIPQNRRHEAVHVFQPFPVNANLLFAAFQAAGIAETAQHVAQINMRLRHLNVECLLEKWHVEPLAIVGNQEVIALNVARKIRQIPPVNVVKHRRAVIHRDRGDVIGVAVQAGCFNIQIRGRVSKFPEHPPLFARWQPLGKIAHLPVIKLLPRAAQFIFNARPFGSKKRQMCVF